MWQCSWIIIIIITCILRSFGRYTLNQRARSQKTDELLWVSSTVSLHLLLVGPFGLVSHLTRAILRLLQVSHFFIELLMFFSCSSFYLLVLMLSVQLIRYLTLCMGSPFPIAFLMNPHTIFQSFKRFLIIFIAPMQWKKMRKRCLRSKKYEFGMLHSQKKKLSTE